MKPQKWWLSWCTFLFITVSEFWPKLEPSHQTILSWVLFKCCYFLKPCCNYVFLVSLLSVSMKGKDECDFHRWVPAFTTYGSALFLERSYFIVDMISLLVVIPIPRAYLERSSRGVFRAQSNIYGGAFLRKKLSIIFAKKLHRRYPSRF